MKTTIGIICALVLFWVVFALAEEATRLTIPEKVAQIEEEKKIDYTQLTDAAIDNIKNIDDVKVYLKLLTAHALVSKKVKDKAREKIK